MTFQQRLKSRPVSSQSSDGAGFIWTVCCLWQMETYHGHPFSSQFTAKASHLCKCVISKEGASIRPGGQTQQWQCTAYTLTVGTTLSYLIIFPFTFRYTPFSIHDATALSSSHPQGVLACNVCRPFRHCVACWLSCDCQWHLKRHTVREPLRLLLQSPRK